MFDTIYGDPELFALIRQDCRENDVGASIANGLLDTEGFLQHDRIVVLKLDAYYSSQRMHNPPPSPDFLVIVRCRDETYHGYIIELRDTTQTAAVRASQIYGKFKTAIEDFIGQRYRHLFFSGDNFIFASLKLYLVTDPLGLRSKDLAAHEYKDRIKGTTLDAYGSLQPLLVGSRPYLIEPVLPDPAILPC